MDISDIHNPILSCTTPDQLPSNIISLPLAFVRSGAVALTDGKVYSIGYTLYSWSRVAISASVVYFLGVNPAAVYPSDNNRRWYGFPLR